MNIPHFKTDERLPFGAARIECASLHSLCTMAGVNKLNRSHLPFYFTSLYVPVGIAEAAAAPAFASECGLEIKTRTPFPRPTETLLSTGSAWYSLQKQYPVNYCVGRATRSRTRCLRNTRLSLRQLSFFHKSQVEILIKNVNFKFSLTLILSCKHNSNLEALQTPNFVTFNNFLSLKTRICILHFIFS